MNNKINKSILIVIVAALCLIISGCSGGETVSQDLPDCETLYGATGYWTNCQGTMTYADNGQYVGEWEDDMRNGQGTYTYANGDQLEGIWWDDEFLYENKGE